MSVDKRFLAKNGLDNNNKTITNVTDPVNAQDVATRNFSSNASNLTSGTIDSARLPGTITATTLANGTTSITMPVVNDDIIFTTAGTERVRVDELGRVGIAVAPSELANSTRIAVKGMGTTSSTNSLSVMTSDGNPIAVFRDDRYVGIGTDSISSPLHVSGAAPVDSIGNVGNWVARLQDTTPSVVGVGGGVLFQGLKSTGGAVGNFGGIAALKENGTNNNEQGTMLLYTTTSDGILTAKVRITSGGDVGIGNVPSYKLDVAGLVNSTSGYRAAVASSPVTIFSADTNGGYVDVAGVNPLRLFTNNSARLTVQGNGNVLIGTTTDDGVNKLQVNGGALCYGSIVSGAANDAARTITVKGTQAQLVIDGTAGNVRDVAFFSSGVPRWLFRVNNTAESGSNFGSDFYINARSDAGEDLGANLFIKRSTGNVIVGTTTDDGVNKLQVNGNGVFNDSIRVLAVIRVNDEVSGNVGTIIRNSGTAYSEIQAIRNNFGFDRPLVLQRQGGNTLIGTTTDDGVNKLQVAGTVAVSSTADTPLTLTSTAAGSYIRFINSADNLVFIGANGDKLSLHTNGSERMTIHDDGNVGIGAPEYTKLTVGGTITATDDTTARAYLFAGSATISLKGRNQTDSGYVSAIYDSTQHIFQASSSEIARIDSTGLGVGNVVPLTKLHVKSSGNIFRIETTTARGSGSNYLNFADPTGSKGYVGYAGGGNDAFYLVNEMNAPLLFGCNAVENMRIDTSGNLLLKTTSQMQVASHSGGSIDSDFQLKDLTSVMSIVTTQNSATGSQLILGKARSGAFAAVQQNDVVGLLGFQAADGTDLANVAGEIRCEIDGSVASNSVPGRVTIRTHTGSSSTEKFRIDSAGHTTPGNSDNTQNFGSGSNRWATIYAGTGSINTSDAREKTTVSQMSVDEISAAKALAQEIGTYKFLASIQEKGETNARKHIGMTVQRAIEIMQTNNLNPMTYGFICYDQWNEKIENDQVVLEAGDRYSFRPDELLMFIARGLEARLQILEAAYADFLANH